MSNTITYTDGETLKEVKCSTDVQDDANKYARKLDDLRTKRENWENNEYKASKAILYEILAACYAILLSIIFKPKQRALLDRYLIQQGVKIQSNTPLATKIVRYVFNTDRKRAYAYSTVIRRAKKEKITVEGLAKWIDKNEGIEEIRLSDPKETTEQKKERIANYKFNAADLVTNTVESKTYIGSISAKDAETIPQSDETDLVLFVGKRADDGSIKIVANVPDKAHSLTNKALEAIGKNIEQTGDAKKLEEQRVEAQNELEDTLDKAAKQVASGTVKTEAAESEAEVIKPSVEDDLELDMDALAEIVVNKPHSIDPQNNTLPDAV